MSFDVHKPRSGTIYSKTNAKVGIDDFKLLKVLGRGAFGKVTLV